MNAMDPTTIDMTARVSHERYLTYDQNLLKVAAPMSSPMASPKVPSFNAEKVEKTSGLPFPNARNVTPAVDSFSPR